MNEDYLEPPFPAYRGDNPYIFISYDYNDLNTVYHEIKKFQDRGFNIFYDEDTKPTDNIIYENLQHIDDCVLFIIFVTDNSVASKKVKKEFRYAINEGKSILAIYFDDFKNINMNNVWTYELLDIRGLYKNNLDEESYMSQIDDAFQNSIDGSCIEKGVSSSHESNDLYISVSYDSSDFELVFKEIRRLQNMGYDVRFNERFDSSNNSLEQIGGCRLLLFFISNMSVASKEVKEEIKYAISNKKPILPIYLENLSETDIDSEINDDLLNGILKKELDEKEYTSEISRQLQNFGFAPEDPTNSKLIPGVGREPLPAYRGENPYGFVSYAHKDSNQVFPEIKRFQDFDYNIWYDEGIAPANEWLEDILNHLDDCVVFIIFITQNSIASVNVKKEIKYAIYKEKPILPIFLEGFDEIQLSNEWKSILSDIQGILKTTMNEEEYVFKVTEAFKKFGFEQYIENIFEKVELKDPEEVLMEDALKNDVLYSDINSSNISQYVGDFFDGLELFEDYMNGHYYKDILKSSVSAFLENKHMYTALEVIKTFFSIYQIIPAGKEYFINAENTISKLVDLVADFWENNNDIDETQKDLFIHSVNVFIFGLVIYSQNGNYRNYFKSHITDSPYEKYYVIDGDFSHEEFLYRWGMASLLHDIYHPFEKASKGVNHSIYEKLDSILGKDRNISGVNDLNIIFKSDPFFVDGYAEEYSEVKFLDLFKPTDIIAHKISLDFPELNLNQLQNSLNQLMDFINKTGLEEHGLISSFLVLNAYGYQIQKFEKDPSLFFYPVVDSATSIFLHNYYKYFLQKKPFKLKQLRPSQNPLAYLLILCDNILEFYKESETIDDNEMNELSDIHFIKDNLNAAYIVKNSSYGFGFSNELFLDDILDISNIFDEGISIITDLSNMDNDYNVFISADDLSINSMELVEGIAVAIRQYIDAICHDNTKDELSDAFIEKYSDLTHFEEESHTYKLSFIREAQSIIKQLNIIGCEIAVKNDKRPPIREFLDEEIDELAKFEHKEWMGEKIGRGWTYGKEKDVMQRVTPYLVSWDELPKVIKESGRVTARNIPHILDSIGLKVVHSKIGLLTYEIYGYYQSNETGIKDFDELPVYIKKLYHKKTDLILDSLSKLDCFIVNESNYNMAINEFDKNEIIYLAQDCHYEWCKLNNSLGWKSGENYDLSLKTNPNLIAWEKLPYSYAKLQVDIFRKLPEFCRKVELKIIKNSYMR